MADKREVFCEVFGVGSGDKYALVDHDEASVTECLRMPTLVPGAEF